MDVEELYRRYYPSLSAKCARMLQSPQEAEEVAQEAFTRFWQSGPKNDDIRSVTAWLYRTSTRLAIDRMRRGRRQVSVADLAPQDQDQPSSIDEEARREARRLLSAIAKEAPQAELEVVLLSRIDGLTHAQIWEVTGRSERTVRRLLRKFDERVGTWTNPN